VKPRLLVIGVLLSIVDIAAWFALVPDRLEPASFLQLNALVVSMFGVGFAAAANGVPTASVAQLLYDAENPARSARRP
jgi:hypothetical protein